ncbi:MAG: hypothetical protein OXN97_15340 [Bryobacterales bacterium]|nr:hypothetical protein [Bryobacterales bacterium]
MRSLVIGGNSRNVGKTGLAVSIINATRDLQWTAVKVTQFGHGVCSRTGGPCGCAVTTPSCPYEISVEDGRIASTDTARMLAAGAVEVLWVRVALGQLALAMPAVRERLAGKGCVLFESNSIMEHWRPDAYLSVLQCDLDDCKASAARVASSADAFVLPPFQRRNPGWTGFDRSLLNQTPLFNVSPPSFCSPDIVEFVRGRMQGQSPTDRRVGAAS